MGALESCGAEEAVNRLIEARVEDEREAERIKAEIAESLRSFDRIARRALQRESAYRPIIRGGE